MATLGCAHKAIVPAPADNRVRERLREGLVIPAHPLALDSNRHLDERHQRALTRYYHAAGAGGIAVGVHTTQFQIRQHGLFEPVLELAAETARTCDRETGRRSVLVGGICGKTPQAIAEARTVRRLGYDAGLLSLGALAREPEPELIEHCRAVAQEIPLFGFYLQPAVGGRILSRSFWGRFLEIPNVVAIKVAPFNRYQTLDVVRALAESGRAGDVSLYTGNDDQIFVDLLTEFEFPRTADGRPVRFSGGLLGHWACWTKTAVGHLQLCREASATRAIPVPLLALGNQVTDANAAIFDAANNFAGCVPGIHEVLRRQGLLGEIVCLDPSEELSAGQAAEIDRIERCYPHLTDNDFVRTHLDDWLK